MQEAANEPRTTSKVLKDSLASVNVGVHDLHGGGVMVHGSLLCCFKTWMTCM